MIWLPFPHSWVGIKKALSLARNKAFLESTTKPGKYVKKVTAFITSSLIEPGRCKRFRGDFSMHQIFNWFSILPTFSGTHFQKLSQSVDTKLLNDIQMSKLFLQIFSQRRLFDLGPLLQEREVYVSSGHTFRAKLLGITLHPRIWTKHGKLEKPKELNRKRKYYIYKIYFKTKFHCRVRWGSLPVVGRLSTLYCGGFSRANFSCSSRFFWGRISWIWPDPQGLDIQLMKNPL